MIAPGWDRYFLDIAVSVAARSKDPSTQVGALIVDEAYTIRATGYNGFPRKVADSDERLRCRETKLALTVHAEANAICAAARVGVPLVGCSLYCTLHPCSRCAALIVQAGIVRVVWPAGEVAYRWAEDFALSAAMLCEAGVAAGAVQ